MHLEWNTETPDGLCRRCGGATALIVPGNIWTAWEGQVDLRKTGLHPNEDVEISEDITAHYCPTCRHVTAVFVNITENTRS